MKVAIIPLILLLLAACAGGNIRAGGEGLLGKAAVGLAVKFSEVDECSSSYEERNVERSIAAEPYGWTLGRGDLVKERERLRVERRCGTQRSTVSGRR